MTGTCIDLGPNFWTKNRLRSGKQIDLVRGQNIPSNSRTIDRTTGASGIVSHKSTDLRCKSYQSPGAVYRLGTSFVRALAAYKGEVRRDHKIKATYFLEWAVESPDAPRVLEWFIPKLGISDQQEAMLERVVIDAKALGVEVVIFRV